MKQILLTVVVCYALILVGAFLFQRRMTYFPDTERPEPAAYGVTAMKPVTYKTGDGLEMTSWFAAPGRDDAPVIVFFHGNAGHYGHRAPKAVPYLEMGYGVLLAGYRGYGGNPGRPTETGLYADGRAAYDWLKSQNVDAARVVLYGESLGSGVATELAAAKPVGAVILEAPFTSIPEVGQRHYWYLPVKWLMRDRFDSLSRIAKVKAPVLVLHSDRDPVVPEEFSKRLYAAANEPKAIREFPGAGHNAFDPVALANAVKEFLDRHLKAGG